MALAAILGSAFDRPDLAGRALVPQPVHTALGVVVLHRLQAEKGQVAPAFALFRHGLPHDRLPHQIPWKAHALALRAVGCEALLVTSSCGLLDPGLEPFVPLPVGDLLMPDNRLPDGRLCTMFDEPAAGQGHLVVRDGLLSAGLTAQLGLTASPVVFAYVPGPRTKTPVENAWWRAAGAQVNSMSVGPEVVLANELEIPTAAVVVGHKASQPDSRAPDGAALKESLARSQRVLERLVLGFLTTGRPVPFGNEIYRFG